MSKPDKRFEDGSDDFAQNVDQQWVKKLHMEFFLPIVDHIFTGFVVENHMLMFKKPGFLRIYCILIFDSVLLVLSVLRPKP